MRAARSIIGCLVLALAAAAAGCSDGGGADEAAPVSTTTTTTAPAPVVPAVAVTAREYAFDVPPVVEGGVVRLTMNNTGRLLHEAVIVAAGERPLPRFKQDLAPIVLGQEKATPPYLRFHGGVSLVPGGAAAESALTLPTGRYVLVCTLTDADTVDPDAPAGAEPPSPESEQFHFERGMAVPFEVRTTNSAAMPETDATLVARDWSFDLPPLSAGTRTYTFRNEGQQDHSVAIGEWPEGVGVDAARSAFEKLVAAHPETAPPDGVPTPGDVAFAGPLSAGASATFTVDFQPGRTYVFACYMSDRQGGPLHALGQDMVAFATTPSG